MKNDGYTICPLKSQRCIPEECEFGVQVRTKDTARKLTTKIGRRHTEFACSMVEFFTKGLKFFNGMEKK